MADSISKQMAFLQKLRPFAVVALRWAVGAVFIFSGLAKGIDLWGVIYKVSDYLDAFGWEWAMPYVEGVRVVGVGNYGVYASANCLYSHLRTCSRLRMLWRGLGHIKYSHFLEKCSHNFGISFSSMEEPDCQEPVWPGCTVAYSGVSSSVSVGGDGHRL